MSFTLNQVVPWGRSFEEYVAMFALTDVDLGGRILGCGDGPASFNAVLTSRGGRIVSVQAVTARLAADGYAVSIETVPYEFQRGGNQMMRVEAIDEPHRLP
jgi:hypothetical protein